MKGKPRRKYKKRNLSIVPVLPETDFILKNNLKALRKARYMSQADLAERMHVHKSTISMWENRLKGIKDRNKIELCKIFKCEITTLFDWGPYE